MLCCCVWLDLDDHPLLPVDQPVAAATSVLFVEFAHIELASQFPEIKTLRAVVTAPCTREVSIELVEGQGKAHDSN